MFIWQEFSGSRDEWNASLIRAKDHNVFQSYDWGLYRQSSGIVIIRYVAINDAGVICGHLQASLKTLPLGIQFFWAPGGPVLNFERNSANNNQELISTLTAKLKEDFPRALIRFHIHQASQARLSFELNHFLVRPFFKLNSGYSVKFILNSTFDARAAMTSKHRYYAKKASNSGLTWECGNSDNLIKSLFDLHCEMIEFKNIPSLGVNLDDLKRIRANLNENCFLLVGFLDGNPVTACLVIIFGTSAFYMTAATGNSGRKISAAYAMVENLLMLLKDKGITSFDFGGLDPISKLAAGVNHFKEGFGGQVIEHQGEWECSKSEALRIAMNLGIKAKGGRL